ncbi:MAG: hypothetical protein LAT67_12220, partial [Balneolales bacterium]|nr:hypothetical protein [Balneolales bacterium]
MKIQKIIPLLCVSCLFLFSAHSQTQAQITFKDVAHPIEDADERLGSYLIAGADGQIFVISKNGSFYRSTDNGNSWEPFETPFEGYEVHDVAGSDHGVLVISSDLNNPGTNGNTWFSEDNGISWQPLGNLRSGYNNQYVVMRIPTIWIKSESITIRIDHHDIDSYHISYNTIYDYDGDWTNDLGGERVLSDGTEVYVYHTYDCSSYLKSFYFICGELILVDPSGDTNRVILYEYDEDWGNEPFYFFINDFEVLTDEHWVLATNLGVYITKDAGDSWTILDDDTLVNSSSIQKSATGELL